MTRALLVKMSSLGDVVHALPAISDAAAHGVQFDWVVEEAFADVARLHPAVSNVLPIAWRRWRRQLLGGGVAAVHRRELREFLGGVRDRSYDVVLDAQGLVKSGVVTALANGAVKFGFSAASAREGVAAVCYGQRAHVPKGQHAIARLRELFAAAFGYSLPNTAPAAVNFGLQPAASPESVCVLLHGTTWASKRWPEGLWVGLARQAQAAGLQVLLPWGNEAEQVAAQRIATAAGAQVWPRQPLADLAARLATARLVVGVDSGLTHLSAALGVPTVAIYGSTDPSLTGVWGACASNLQAEFACAPCLARECGYAGAEVPRWQGQVVYPPCYSRVDPDAVWAAATELMDAHRVQPI